MTDARAWQGERLLKLTPKAFAVLHSLLEQAGRLVTKAELMRVVWAETVVTDGALVTCIRELRKALKDDAQTPRYIETVQRRGYRFIGPLATTPPPSQKVKVESQKSSLPSHLQTLPPPLVGRDAELAQLQGCWEQALAGKRQVVFVTGEPGIGKTSVVRAFLSQLGSQGWGLEPNSSFFQASSPQSLVPGVWVGWGQCIEQYGEGEPYRPVLEAVGRLCRGPEGKRLIPLLTQHAPTWLVQLSAVLSPTDYDALQRRTHGAPRERMLRELAEVMEVLTAEQPLILVVEDLHWSDPSTVDVLPILARRSVPARLLVLGTYRPIDVITREHPLKALKTELQLHQQCQELPLEPWSEAQVGEYLVQRFAGETHGCTSLELARLVHQRTEGTPLFVAAMVDELLPRGLLMQTDAGWELQETPATGEEWIPDTIRQLVSLQSGRIPPAEQQMLEAASVAGLEFSAAVVAAALTSDTVEIERRCEHLADRQYFLHRVGVEEWPDGTLAARYGFSHAVYQHLWHERVSPTQLQQYHLRIGERKERAYGEHTKGIAVELAVHFEQGRDYRKAVQYYGQAAQNAFQRHALNEVTAHAAMGLLILRELPETPERDQQELLLQMLLGAALMTTHGFAAPEVGHVYTRALTLCRQLGESPQLFPVLFGLALFYAMQGQLHTALEIDTQLQQLARRYPDPLYCTEVQFVSGLLSFNRGELTAAQTFFERSLALYEPQQASAHILMYGQNPGVASSAVLALVCWLRGYPEQAVVRIQTALALARESAHPYNLTAALFNSAVVYQFLGQVQSVQAHTGELLSFAQAQSVANGGPYGMVLRGWTLAELGQVGEGLAHIHEGLEKIQALGAETGKAHCLALLAETYGKVGKEEEGLSLLTEALSWVDKTGERFHEAELYRLKGELTLQLGTRGWGPKTRPPSAHASSLKPQVPKEVAREAEECFLKAIDIARQQQAKSWELRAVMSLVRLRQQQAAQPGSRTTQHASRVRHDEARQMLTAVYNWFTEGFDTKDLREAKALLDELSH